MAKKKKKKKTSRPSSKPKNSGNSRRSRKNDKWAEEREQLTKFLEDYVGDYGKESKKKPKP